MFKVNNRKTRTKCKMRSNFGVVLVSLLLTLNIFTPYSNVSIVKLCLSMLAWEVVF